MALLTTAAMVLGSSWALSEIKEELEDKKIPSSKFATFKIRTLKVPSSTSPLLLKASKFKTGTPPKPKPKPLGFVAGKSLSRGHWTNLGSVISYRRFKKIRFYASPPGALRLVSRSRTNNFIWYTMCPSKWKPGYKRAKRKNVRISLLKPLLGPRADWKTLTGTIGDMVKTIPGIVKSAAEVGGAVASAGATAASVDVEGIIENATASLKAAGGIVSKSRARVDAANAIVRAIFAVYYQELRDANPHLVKKGALDLGKNYMKNPKTTADLSAPGSSYPWVYLPIRE